MNKLLIITLLLLIFPIIHATSLNSAQDIAREYLLPNESLDSSVYYVKCDINEYYVLNIIDTKQTIVMFLPIESNNGTVVYETNTNTQKIIKTSLLYRNIKTETSKNYLSQQLIDRIDNLGISLKSKSAKLDGVIASNYSASITTKCQEAKVKLDLLIDQLENVDTKLTNLQKTQNPFIEAPNCSQTDNLIYLYKTSFAGYNDLIASSMSYIDSTNAIVEVVVADQKLDETTKRVILSYTDAPTTLSSDISTITDYISSTSQFYANVISDFERVGPSSPLEILQQTLKSRQDYYVAKTLLYSYDNELKSTLDNAITQILSEENINLWKDTKTVSELSQNYAQLKELYNKGRYQESISKLKLAKSQVKKIKAAGTETLQSQDISKYLIYTIIGIIVILGVIILIKNLKHRKKKPKTKSKEIDPEYLLNKKDPFN